MFCPEKNCHNNWFNQLKNIQDHHETGKNCKTNSSNMLHCSKYHSFAQTLNDQIQAVFSEDIRRFLEVLEIYISYDKLVTFFNKTYGIKCSELK